MKHKYFSSQTDWKNHVHHYTNVWVPVVKVLPLRCKWLRCSETLGLPGSGVPLGLMLVSAHRGHQRANIGGSWEDRLQGPGLPCPGEQVSLQEHSLNLQPEPSTNLLLMG